jgi:uncharacterized protein (TIGR00369 family)
VPLDNKPSVQDYDEAMKQGDWARAIEINRQRVPLHNQMGLDIVHKDPTSILMTMELSESVRGATAGSIHGGMLATFADVASAFSLDQSYDIGSVIPVTTDMHIRYYRQPRLGPLQAKATVLHRGRQLLSTECSIVDAEDRVLARSTATYMLVPYPGSDRQSAASDG